MGTASKAHPVPLRPAGPTRSPGRTLEPSRAPPFPGPKAQPGAGRRIRRWARGLVAVALAAGAAAAMTDAGRLRHLAFPVLADPSSHTHAPGAALDVLPPCTTTERAHVTGRAAALLEAQDGTLWAGGFDSGVTAFPAKGPAVAVAGLEGKERFINALAEHGGRIWVATYNGLLELDPRGRRRNSHLRGAAVEALLAVGNGTRAGLLAGTPGGLFRLTPQGNFEDTLLRGPAGESLRATSLALNGDTLWIGTSRGAYVVPLVTLTAPRSRRIARWAPLVFGEPGAETNTVMSLAPLGDGVIAGTDNGGLAWVSAARPVRAVRFAEPRANELNPGAALVHGGRVFLGTQGGGLLIAGEGARTGRPAGWPHPTVSALGGRAHLYAGTETGAILEVQCPAPPVAER